MFLSQVISIALALSLAVTTNVNAETHTITLDNKCGSGTPQLKQSGNVLSTGRDYTANGPIKSAIAYLQTGSCGLDGEGCTLIETTLINPNSTPGSGSSSDISLVGNHKFSVASGFKYFNGCDGKGADCTSANCPDAWPVQVACQEDNVNLAITFCG